MKMFLFFKARIQKHHVGEELRRMVYLSNTNGFSVFIWRSDCGLSNTVLSPQNFCETLHKRLKARFLNEQFFKKTFENVNTSSIFLFLQVKSKGNFSVSEGDSLTTTVTELSLHLSEPVMQNSPTSACCKYNH